MTIRKYLILFVISVISLQGCIKDNIQTEPEIFLNSSAEILFQLESNGDYINSLEMPSLMSATSLYNSLGNCILIDIRDSLSFSSGHIETAVLINPEELLEYVLAVPQDFEQVIVIISDAGQSASYYTCLLRLYGIRNVFALKFGMASWHKDFADIWLKRVQSQFAIARLDNITYDKPDFGDLPAIPGLAESGSLNDKLQQRIADMFSDKFIESVEEIDNTTYTIEGSREIASIDVPKILADFNPGQLTYNDVFIMCYGPPQLYTPYGFADKEPEIPAHPINSVYYRDANTIPGLRSSTNLQTLPVDKVIVIYSVTGHTSAFIAAYLRVLGYDAKSIVYGGNCFLYEVLQFHKELADVSFSKNEIMNYPYSKLIQK